MQDAPSAQETPSLEMSLRDHLLAAGSHNSHQTPYPPPPTAGGPGPDHPYQGSDQANSHDHLDPNVTGSGGYGMGGDSGGDEGVSPQAGKGKRELSTSKRAAQNRAAQRAFRQRKETYIKKLEEQVKEFSTVEQNYRALQNENYQLREYILNLQSRLLENHTDYPPAPSHINLQPSSLVPPPRADPISASDQLRREMQRSATGGAANDNHRSRSDGVAQLQAAVAAQAGVRTHESPYADYAKRAHAGADAPPTPTPVAQPPPAQPPPTQSSRGSQPPQQQQTQQQQHDSEMKMEP